MLVNLSQYAAGSISDVNFLSFLKHACFSPKSKNMVSTRQLPLIPIAKFSFCEFFFEKNSKILVVVANPYD